MSGKGSGTGYHGPGQGQDGQGQDRVPWAGVRTGSHGPGRGPSSVGQDQDGFPWAQGQKGIIWARDRTGPGQGQGEFRTGRRRFLLVAHSVPRATPEAPGTSPE